MEKNKENPTEERLGHWNLKINRVSSVEKRISELAKQVWGNYTEWSTERLRNSQHKQEFKRYGG